MAKDFRPVDRFQQFLLPPDVRDWLAPEHLAWFVIDVVDGMDMSEFEARSKLGGTGRAPFDPRVLLSVLLYGYSVGERSSRQLERLCGQDVAFRVITGNECPDHCTIARFRAVHESAFKDVFAQVLQLCAAAGMARLGLVAIDGTKIAASAAKSANATEDKLRAEVDRIVEQAVATDAGEDELFGDARGDELPEQLRNPVGRPERVRKALAELEAVKRAAEGVDEATAKAAAEYEAMMADPSPEANAARAGAGKPPKGTDPVRLAELRLERAKRDALQRNEQRKARFEERQAKAQQSGRKLRGGTRPPVMLVVEQFCRVKAAQAKLDAARAATAAAQTAAAAAPVTGKALRRNTTDPDSRMMKCQGGWTQGYNAQIAVAEDQIILDATVTQDHNDVDQLVPMMANAQAAAETVARSRPQPDPDEKIGTVLFDAGYMSESNLKAPGPPRLIPDGKAHATQKAAETEPATGPPPPGSTHKQAMAHTLRTPAGIADYGKRKVLVEPVNGHLKDRQGMRVFSRRGLTAVDSELKLAAAVANLNKLHRNTLATAS